MTDHTAARPERGADAPLWTPRASWREDTRVGAFTQWVEAERGRSFAGWDDLWRWSVTELEEFWGCVGEFFGVTSAAPPGPVLEQRVMPGARWFPGARLNYAEHLLGVGPGAGREDEVAVVACSQTRQESSLTFGQLREQVTRARAALQALGVRRGDRVAAYLPNIPETLVAFLATASLGAVWASCAPEFGVRSVVDRFAQIEPRVLLAVTGYRYGTKDVDRLADVEAVRAQLPSVQALIHVPYAGAAPSGSLSWPDLLDAQRPTPPPPTFEPVPFDHPMVVLFSSGTTGLPKAIVHGHGGILLEHLKNHALSWDLGPGDRLAWFTTTAWMMWNSLVSALAVGASIVMIDGDPTFPDVGHQWEVAARTGATVMGASPGFLMASRAAGLRPARDLDLSALKQIGSAGSPLPPEGSFWVREQFGPSVLLNVGSGGTDVCSGLVQGSPAQPGWAGRISGPCLGVDAKAFDADGAVVVGELGELVITAPMPSMPVGFWGDADGSRYLAAYFSTYPGVWRHGDWVRFDADGACVVAGRSDATLNRGGVRLGTAEFYRVVEELPEVTDSLVVHVEDPAGGNGALVLLVALASGGGDYPEEEVSELDADLRGRIVAALRRELSPRHVPDEVVAVPVVPRNRTGKKLELPVKRILAGHDPAEVADLGSLADPTSLDAVIAYAATRNPTGKSRRPVRSWMNPHTPRGSQIAAATAMDPSTTRYQAP